MMSRIVPNDMHRLHSLRASYIALLSQVAGRGPCRTSTQSETEDPGLELETEEANRHQLHF